MLADLFGCACLTVRSPFETQGNGVGCHDEHRQEETGRLAEPTWQVKRDARRRSSVVVSIATVTFTGSFHSPQRNTSKAHGATPVHWVAHDIEWESSDHVIHENAKVVTQISTCDTECPHRRDDKDVSRRDEGSSDDLDGGERQERVDGLILERVHVEVVTEDAQGEDGGSQQVAAQVSVAIEDP